MPTTADFLFRAQTLLLIVYVPIAMVLVFGTPPGTLLVEQIPWLTLTYPGCFLALWFMVLGVPIGSLIGIGASLLIVGWSVWNSRFDRGRFLVSCYVVVILSTLNCMTLYSFER